MAADENTERFSEIMNELLASETSLAYENEYLHHKICELEARIKKMRVYEKSYQAFESWHETYDCDGGNVTKCDLCGVFYDTNQGRTQMGRSLGLRSTILSGRSSDPDRSE